MGVKAKLEFGVGDENSVECGVVSGFGVELDGELSNARGIFLTDNLLDYWKMGVSGKVDELDGGWHWILLSGWMFSSIAHSPINYPINKACIWKRNSNLPCSP